MLIPDMKRLIMCISIKACSGSLDRVRGLDALCSRLNRHTAKQTNKHIRTNKDNTLVKPEYVCVQLSLSVLRRMYPWLVVAWCWLMGEGEEESGWKVVAAFKQCCWVQRNTHTALHAILPRNDKHVDLNLVFTWSMIPSVSSLWASSCMSATSGATFLVTLAKGQSSLHNWFLVSFVSALLAGCAHHLGK